MIRKTKIGKINLKFVFRHRFEKHIDEVDRAWDKRSLWREWRLGLWVKPYKAVGQKNFKNPSLWSANLANGYMIGVDLLICKFWIDINRGVMEF